MIPVSLEGLFKMLRRVVPSSTKVQMSSWANFYRKLAHEARCCASDNRPHGKDSKELQWSGQRLPNGSSKRGDSFGADPYSNSFSWASSSRYNLSERNRGLG